MWKVRNRISARPETLITSLRPIEDLINHDIKLLFICFCVIALFYEGIPLLHSELTHITLLESGTSSVLYATKITQLGISRTNISEKKA